MNKKQIILFLISWVTVLILLLTSLGVGYLAYQTRNELEKTQKQLVLTKDRVSELNQTLAEERVKTATYKKCVDGINSGKLLPDVEQKGDTFVISYDCQ